MPKPTPPTQTNPPAAPPAPPAASDEPTAQPNFVDERGREWGFPINTPLTSMSAEQREAYWKEKAKKHERAERLSARQPQGAPAPATPPAPGTDTATPPTAEDIASARQQGARDAQLATLPDTLTVLLAARAPHLDEDDIEEIIDDLDLNKFLTAEGRLDMARVNKLAEKHADKADGSANPAGLQPGDPLAQALSHNRPGAPGNGAGSIATLRQQERDRLTPQKKS